MTIANLSENTVNGVSAVFQNKATASYFLTVIDTLVGSLYIDKTPPNNLVAKVLSTSWPSDPTNAIRFEARDDGGTFSSMLVRVSSTHAHGVTVTVSSITETTLTDGSGQYERRLSANQADAMSITDGTSDLATWQTTTGNMRRKYAVPVELNDSGTATASGTGGTSTVTLSKQNGVITTDAITTAAGAVHVMTVTNTLVAATSRVLCEININGSTGTPIIASVEPGAGSFVVRIANIHASAAINAALKITFLVLP